MPTLHYGSGASGYTVEGLAIDDATWMKRRAQLARVLASRKQTDALNLLNRLPWKVYDGDNHFHDEFLVLYCYLPVEVYVDSTALEDDAKICAAAKVIAETLREIHVGYVRFVGFGIQEDEEIETRLPTPDPEITSETVKRAVNDAMTLISSGSGFVSAVDRAHTALHGYLTEHCNRLGVPIANTGPRDSTAVLFKRLRNAHPAFVGVPHSEDIAAVAQSLATALDRTDKLRNNASIAHPNELLLEEPEARLAVNAVWTILHYLDARLSPLK